MVRNSEDKKSSVLSVPCAATELPTRNGKKPSSSQAQLCQAQLGLAKCLAVASFLSISCGQSCGCTLYALLHAGRIPAAADEGEPERATVNFPVARPAPPNCTPLPTSLYDTDFRALAVARDAGFAQICTGTRCKILYYRTGDEGQRERKRERGRERASGTAPLRPSDTNFSWKDICSTCSSHLSLSRLYIPFLARSLEQAAKETEGFLKKDDCRLKMFKEYAEFSALLFAAAALQGHNRNTEF